MSTIQEMFVWNQNLDWLSSLEVKGIKPNFNRHHVLYLCLNMSVLNSVKQHKPIAVALCVIAKSGLVF